MSVVSIHEGAWRCGLEQKIWTPELGGGLDGRGLRAGEARVAEDQHRYAADMVCIFLPSIQHMPDMWCGLTRPGS
jgi:hypothetical protein